MCPNINVNFIFRFLMKALGLPESTPKSRLHASSGGSTFALAQKYFATISKQQFDALEDYYQIDLLAFGYSASDYDIGTGFRS